MIHKHLAVMLVLAVVGCGGAPPKQAGEENNFEQPTVPAPTSPSGSEGAEPASGGEGELNEDQKAQMEIALRRGGKKAANCGDVAAGTPTGKGDVEITFDGKKGRIVNVAVAAPWAGTAAEACIKQAFVNEIVLPFDGDPKVVPYTVEIPEKKAGDAAKAPKK